MSSRSVESTLERNYGIDLLRLFAMFMIVCWHIIDHGGVLIAAQEAGTDAYTAVWFVRIICMCAVDCFAIITGYVSYGSRYRYGRYFKTWVQVSFISLSISVLFFVLYRSIGLGTVLFSALPVFSGKYWYFTAYTGVYLLMPIINAFAEKTELKQFNRHFLIMVVGLFIYSPFSQYMFGSELLKFGGGYSIPWLAFLYLMGIWLKRNPIRKIKTVYIVLMLCISIGGGMLLRIYDNGMISGIVLKYEGTLVVSQALAWFCLFERAKLPHFIKRIVIIFAPSAFSVYLIHDNPIIRETFIENHFSWIVVDSTLFTVSRLVGVAFVIFGLCLCLDFIIRRPIFKALNVSRRFNQITSR